MRKHDRGAGTRQQSVDFASANYGLPAGTYTIEAAYSDGSGTNFSSSTDDSHKLTVNAAGTSIQASNAGATYFDLHERTPRETPIQARI
jgi:hypothetical protein